MLTKACPECGQQFEYTQQTHTYCSRRCKERARYRKKRRENPLLHKQCGFCDTRYFASRTDQKYCSKQCRWRAKARQQGYASKLPDKSCEICGTQFSPITRRHRACSPRCSKELDRRRDTQWARERYIPAKPRIKTCVKCGRPFTAYGNQKYCHDPCVYEQEYKYIPVPRETRRCAVCNQEFGAVANQVLCDDPDCKSTYHKRDSAARIREKRANDPEFRESELERLEQWKSEHPDRDRIHRARRDRRLAELPSTLTVSEWEATLDFFGGCCAYCGRESDEIHQEHFIPVAMGGGYTKENIVPSCPNCNFAKNAIDPYEWLTAQPDGAQIFTHIAHYLSSGCGYT